MVATVKAVKKGKHGGVKAKSKKGKATVPQVRWWAKSSPTPGLIALIGDSLDALLDGLTYAVTTVYEFMGKVFYSIVEWCTGVMSWLNDCVRSAAGSSRQAFEYIRNMVATKNVDWIAVNTLAIKVLCAAAAVGCGIAGGLIVGGTAAAAAVGAGATVANAQIVGVIATAITAGVLSETCYTLFKAGVHIEDIAIARQKAIAGG